MRRTAKMGEFRSNIHRGGEGTPIDIDPEYARVALEATAIVGLQVAGVDMLEAKTGPKVIELNSSPGFEGLEAATSMDVAGLLIRYAVDYARQKMRARRMMPAAAPPEIKQPAPRARARRNR
jgi:ribosomal protein S6--L-glutamate ligase